ncbi:hypothetical protein GQ42DRAFT_103692, partial [Ramicandelaber brevisporus]
VLTISCTHCRLTLSFRGMEAVLVTQPVTRCYSTDINGYGRRHSYGPGSCECLIQSMACYGCGNTVGYYIQRPCQRCVQRRLRTRAYFHLWVFNSADTEAEQR